MEPFGLEKSGYLVPSRLEPSGLEPLGFNPSDSDPLCSEPPDLGPPGLGSSGLEPLGSKLALIIGWSTKIPGLKGVRLNVGGLQLSGAGLK